MTELVDYSSARPSPAGLVAAGKTGVGRYVGKLGSVSKQLGPTEAAALRAQGLDIFLLVEEAANGAMGGFATGAAHAATAVDAAAALGASPATALYFAVDFDVTAAQWPTVANYLRGAASKCGAARVGIYGGYNAMIWAARDRVASWFFQTYAWSDIDHNGAPNWAPNNHIEQYHNGVTVAGGDVDLCRSKVANFGQWVAPSGPTPTEDDVKTIWLIKLDGKLYWYDGTVRWAVNDLGNEAYVRLGRWGESAPNKADGPFKMDVRAQSINLYTGPYLTPYDWGTSKNLFGVDLADLACNGAGALIPHTHELPAIPAEPSGPAVAS